MERKLWAPTFSSKFTPMVAGHVLGFIQNGRPRGAAEFRHRRITLGAAAVNPSARSRILFPPPHFFRMWRRDLALPYETRV